MMRSMYSGVSGLKVHQTKMDVIGNNIANVNTIGYKKGQVNFQEAFNQVIKSAGSPSGGKGGTNPQQIGLGVQIGSINTVHTQGVAQRTDNATDLMVDGDGYFIVSDDPNAENQYYTRAGNFALDLTGNLVTPNGYKVLGEFIGDASYAKALGITNGKDIDSIKINKSIAAPATASTAIEVRGNLDSRLEDDISTPSNNESIYQTDAIIKDSLGISYKIDFKFEHDISDISNPAWDVTFEVKNIDTDATIVGTSLDVSELKFNGDGEIISGMNPTLNFSGTSINGDGTDGTPYFGTDTNKGEVKLDFSKLTQFANESDAKGFDIENENGQSGRSSGALTGFTIDPAGKVVASFSNGEKKELWQMKTAKFDNPMGLVKTGSNLFTKSTNSGDPQIGKPGNSGLGSISSGTLEMSNVDLSMEFTEMITTQRGFQANSRIITTTDEMLQELTNMKR